MRTQTDNEPTSQIDDETWWNGEVVKESTNEVSNSNIIFDDFDDDDFENIIFADPYASQEINLCEKSFDNNDVDFLDDSLCMLFDEGDNISVMEIDLSKDVVKSIVVDEIEPKLNELDSIDVRIENVYMPFVDPIWEDFV